MHLQKSRRIVCILFLLILFLILGIGGLVAFVTAIYKDTYVVKGDTTMSNAKGEIVLTGVATHDLPLIVAPVLPLKELFSVETIRVTVPGSTAGPADVGSGEAINEAGPSVTSIRMFRISGVEKINSTVVVFHALGGEQIRVWNGATTVRLSVTGPEIPICSANVTCAAFQVKGAELAEKYLTEAEALLEPFAEGRRRLAEQCIDPFGWTERDVAQKQLACTNPTTEQGCKALAHQMGLTWESYKKDDKTAQESSGDWVTKGCFTYKEGAQFVIYRSNKLSFAQKHPFTVNLHGQAFFGTGGTDAQMNTEPGGTDAQEIRLPMLDPACLALSNQAKLEANLNKIGSKVSWIMSATNLQFAQAAQVSGQVAQVARNVMIYDPTVHNNGASGLLLTWYNNNWGTVCDDFGTDQLDLIVTVACRALGYVGGIHISIDGQSSGYPIVADDKGDYLSSCTGNEALLTECPGLSFGHTTHNCGHHEDIGVRCYYTAF